MIFLLLLLQFVGKIWEPKAIARDTIDVNIETVHGSYYSPLLVKIQD